MELRQYAAILWRWLWFVILSTALTAGITYVVSKRTVPVYQASTTLLVNQAKNTVTDNLSLVTSDQLSRTYAELMRKRPVLEEVINRLQLPFSAGGLAGQIKIQPVPNTQLMVVTVEDTNPSRAASIANEVPQVFIQQNEAVQTKRFADSKAALAKQLERMQADIARSQQDMVDLRSARNPDQAEMDRLQRDIAERQNLYTSLLRSYEDVRLAEARQVDTLVVVEPAEPSSAPVRPQTAQTTLLAGVVGALIALGLVFLKEYLDDTVKTPEDVERISGFSTLGAIARIPGRGKEGHFLFRMESQAPIAEAYRALRTSISFSGIDRPVRTLLVTSSRPGEGKTTTAVNVACIMASAGIRVLLVDTDFRRPSLHRAFALPNDTGLTTLLLTGIDPNDGVIQPSPVENLRVITSGPRPPNPSELLGSRRMIDMVGRLATEADVVIFDSPPVLAVTDAMLLAPHIDGTMIVLEAGMTREPALRQAAGELARVSARVVGVVFNKLRASHSLYYYYYYYYYGYYSSDHSNGNGHHPSGTRRSRAGKSEQAGPLATISRVFGGGNHSDHRN